MATVSDGDCIVSIAKTLGVRDYKNLWTANSTLQSKRTNPNMLVIGDTVEEPPKTKVEVKKTGSRYTFAVVDVQPASLQIVLLDADSKPLGEAAWELTSPVSKSGTTGTDGIIKIDDLPVDAKKGALKVTPKVATPVTTTASTTSASGPPPYPAPIKPAEYKDAVRAAEASDAFVQWDLNIGSLPSFNDTTGVVARLENLGGDCAGGSGTTASVKAYQRAFLNQKTGSGTPSDIQDDLRDRHDKKP